MSPPPPDGNASTTATAGIHTVQDAVPSTATGVEAKPTAANGTAAPAPVKVDGEPKFQHPLDPLTPEEIAAVTLAIRQYTAAKTDIRAVKFITCTHLAPPKRQVLAALGIPTEPGKRVSKEDVESARKAIVRRAEADFLDVVAGRAYNATLALSPTSEWEMTALTLLPSSYHPQISVEELIAAELTVRENPTIQALAAAVGVKPHQIFCDGWSIGYDDRFDQTRRVQQALVFARLGDEEHDNLYAHPMDFVPVIDANTNELLHVDFPAVWKKDESVKELVGAMKGIKLSSHSTAPPPIAADNLAAAQRERIPPPPKKWDFLPDLMQRTADAIPKVGEDGLRVLNEKGEEETQTWTTRKDLKPLHVVQPEGVSFKMDGHTLEWQNWKMHIAFTHREGIALSTITYNDHGEIRPILYRLSLAEMVVPYGAPENPHPRKFAFDSGEYGMGTMANELSLGCDCLGQIHYIPGTYVAHDGSAVVIKNVICIHEEDAGVLWKHTDYRPGGRSHTVRRRRLVVSMVCTLANYEYIWNYLFYQDGSIEFEIRLTGILSVYVAQDGEPNPFGTTVAPGINAHYHQHMFSLRLDPMIDGLSNTVIESDIKPVPQPTGSAANFAGNAFASHDTPVATEGGRAYDYATERRWRIVNRGRTHYSSGKAVGYAIGVKGGATPMMAKSDGWAARRAAFLANTVWVCRDVESEDGLSGTERMWPAGKYVPQTKEEPEDSVGSWVKDGKKTEDEDLLVFVTVGTTHIPRPEDWPVMPVEHLSVTLKPNSFFTANPSMDVPASNDPLSVAAFGDSKPNGHAAPAACCNSN